MSSGKRQHVRRWAVLSAAVGSVLPAAWAAADDVFTDGATQINQSGTTVAGGLFTQVFAADSFPNVAFANNAPYQSAAGFSTLQTILDSGINLNPGTSTAYGTPDQPGGTNWTNAGINVTTGDNFVARWSGYFNATSAGAVNFTISADDGGFLYIDGVRVLVRPSNGTISGSVNLTAGSHEFLFVSYDNAGNNPHRLLLGTSTSTATAIPTSLLTGVQSGPIVNAGTLRVQTTAAATLNVTGALKTTYDALSFETGNATLVLAGASLTVNSTSFSNGGVINLAAATNSAFTRDFDLGAINDGGLATTINKAGGHAVIVRAGGTAAATTFNVGGGNLVLVNSATATAADQAVINLNAPAAGAANSQLLLSTTSPSGAAFNNDVVIASGQTGSVFAQRFGTSSATGTPVITWTDPNGVTLAGNGTLRLGSEGGYRLVVGSAISGAGNVVVTVPVSGLTGTPSPDVFLDVAGGAASTYSGSTIVNFGTFTLKTGYDGTGNWIVNSGSAGAGTGGAANLGNATVNADAPVHTSGALTLVGGAVYNANVADAAAFRGNATFGNNTFFNYNANAAGGTTAASFTANGTATGANLGGQLQFATNVTTVGDNEFAVNANNVLLLNGATGAGLLTRATSVAAAGNLVLAANSIVAQTVPGAAAAVNNMGLGGSATADVYLGLNASMADNFALGAGTGFKGLSNVRTAVTYNGGTITAQGDFEIRPGYTNATLNLGNGTAAVNIVAGTGGPRVVTLTNASTARQTVLMTTGNDGAAGTAFGPSDFSGVSRLVVSGNLTLQGFGSTNVGQNLFGGATGADSVVGLIDVLDNGLFDPGIGVGGASGASPVNTSLLVRNNGILFLNDNDNLNSANGTVSLGFNARVDVAAAPFGARFVADPARFTTAEGVRVRVTGNVTQSIDPYFNDASRLIVFGGTRSMVGTFTLNNSGTNVAILTADNASRTLTGLTLNVGAAGATVAAGGTNTLTLNTGFRLTAAGTVTFGATGSVDGVTLGGGLVNISGTAGTFFAAPAVNVANGRLTLGGGGITYAVGAANTGPLNVATGTQLRVETGSLIGAAVMINAGATNTIQGLNSSSAANYGSLAGAGFTVLGVTATNTAAAVMTFGVNNLNTEYSGVISQNYGTNTLSFAKAGTGLMALSGTNTFTGLTSVLGGTLAVVDNGRLSAGNAQVTNNATLRLASANSTITGARVNLLAPNAVLGLDSDFDPTSLLNAGTGTNSSGILALNAPAHATPLDMALLGRGNMFLGSNAPTNVTVLTGTSATATRAVPLAGNGSYTALNLGANADGNYRLGGGGGTLSITQSALTGPGGLFVGNGTSAGAVNLLAANTYDGETTVNANATLLVNNATGSATGANLVGVEVGGTLGGSGRIAGTGVGSPLVSVAGNLAPGGTGATGTLRVVDTNLTPGSGPAATLGLLAGSNFRVEIDSASSFDAVDLVGTIDVTSANLLVTLNYTPSLNTQFKIVDNDGAADPVSGAFLGLTQGAFVPGTDLQIDYAGGDGNDIVLTAVPEPGTALLAIAAAGLLTTRRRRRTA